MNKQDLIDKIKSIAKDKYSKQIEFTSGGETNTIAKYPSVNDVLVDLMTEQYEIFVVDVEWVAPKPTTFRIMLANGEYFFLTHTDRSWIAQIEGKNFYLLSLNEKQDAMNAIARVLRYGKGKTDTQESTAAPDTTGGEEIPAEATPEELPSA
jgi:hypothetical protein